MTLTPLQAEVMARMESLGGTVTASMVAWHGERLSTGAVWRAMEDLYCAGKIDHVSADGYRLPVVRGVVHEPLAMEVGE